MLAELVEARSARAFDRLRPHPAHDQLRRRGGVGLAPVHLDKPGRREQADRAAPLRRSGPRRASGINRIALEQGQAVLLSEIDHLGEQRMGDPTMARPGRDDEADHRGDRLIIDRLQTRETKRAKSSRGRTHPARRTLIVVGDQAGRVTSALGGAGSPVMQGSVRRGMSSFP